MRDRFFQVRNFRGWNTDLVQSDANEKRQMAYPRSHFATHSDPLSSAVNLVDDLFKTSRTIMEA
jgi:hypothetical protein